LRMADNLVDALAEFGIRIGRKSSTHSCVGGLECAAAVFAEVVPAGGNAKMNATAVSIDRVQAQAAGAGLPLSGVFVIADARHHLPRVAPIGAAKQRRGLDAA